MTQVVKLYDKKRDGTNTIDMIFKIQDGNLYIFEFFIGDGYSTLFGHTDFSRQWGDKPVVRIEIIQENTNMQELMPNSYESGHEEYIQFSGKGMNPPLKNDTPIMYNFRLSGFYVKARISTNKTEKEKRYFRGIGSELLSFILNMIDPSGESILGLEAHGSTEPILQKKLVDYYKTIGFKTGADLSEIGLEYFRNAICMYSNFSTLWERTGNPRFISK